MKTTWVLSGVGDRPLQLELPGSGDQKKRTIGPVLTTQDVCVRLRKSRRQLYRYLRAGRLQPCARVWGQWLFAKPDVDRFTQTGVPLNLRRFFWDVRLSTLSIEGHRDFILSRILEYGDLDASKWARRTYPRAELVAFLLGRGAEILSKRAWHFWAVQLGVQPTQRRKESWRARGRALGGVS